MKFQNEEEYLEMRSLSSYIANNMKAELWITSAKTGHSVTDLFQRISGMAFESYVHQILLADNEDKEKITIDQFLSKFTIKICSYESKESVALCTF